eukprot:393469_1
MSSLWRSFHPCITVVIVLILCGNIGLIIWSYGLVEQYVKMAIAIPDFEDGIKINFTEYPLSIPSEIKDLWNSEAYGDAVVFWVSAYFWPFFKFDIYLIIWFVSFRIKYQFNALWHINQWHRMMFIILYDNVITSKAFSFTMYIPYITENYNVNTTVQAYP